MTTTTTTTPQQRKNHAKHCLNPIPTVDSRAPGGVGKPEGRIFEIWDNALPEGGAQDRSTCQSWAAPERNYGPTVIFVYITRVMS